MLLLALLATFVVRQTLPNVLLNSATPDKHQIETMPGGVALFDYDADGRLDILVTNGARQPDLRKSGPEYHNRLYRNLGNWRFEDVTERAGVSGEGYSMGVAAGDYDNDGHVDFFVTGVGRNLLYRNRGDGSFESKPFPGTGWSIAAGWMDFDLDGDLDLFVVNYVHWDPVKEPFCGDAKAGYRTYCHPKYYEGLPNSLFRNDGEGRFTDISRESGIGAVTAKGMAVAFADYDSDGYPDVFITSDTTPNLLFHNEGGKRFRDVAVAAGVAVNDDGRALSSMGADFRDYNNDGRPDVFVTALANETFPLYRNEGKSLFLDVTYPLLIGAATLALSGWSAGIYDFDNDGWKDIFTANGDVNDNTEVFSSRASRQRNLLLWNQQGKSFRAELLGEPAMHRGAAFGDLDGDGAVDVVVTRLNGSPVLLRNESAAGKHWIGFKLNALGARVRIVTALGEQWNHSTTAVGYASSSDPAVHFGLGTADRVKQAEIQWPGGKVQQLGELAVDRYWTFLRP